MPLELKPLEMEQLSEVVGRAVDPRVVGPAKMMAAKGLAPMGPRDLVTALYQLTFDVDAQVSAAAKKTAPSLPENILAGALGEPLEALVLHFFAGLVLDRPPLLEKILLNHYTHDETFAFLAKRVSGQPLEILAGNQERLLRTPAIIEEVYFNREARQSTVERLLELAVRNGLKLERIPQFKEFAATILDSGAAPAQPEIDGETLDAAFRTAMTEEDSDEAAGEKTAVEEVADERLTTFQVSQLPISAKMRLASLGSASHRAILVKDSNRLVAMSAIKSPAVSEQEATVYSANRSLQDEVIRYIAGRKEWQKNYTIKLNLANNPKCPMAYSLRILNYLRLGDLRNLMRSKNIPSALVKAAKAAVRKKGG